MLFRAACNAFKDNLEVKCRQVSNLHFALEEVTLDLADARRTLKKFEPHPPAAFDPTDESQVYMSQLVIS